LRGVEVVGGREEHDEPLYSGHAAGAVEGAGARGEVLREERGLFPCGDEEVRETLELALQGRDKRFGAERCVYKERAQRVPEVGVHGVEVLSGRGEVQRGELGHAAEDAAAGVGVEEVGAGRVRFGAEGSHGSEELVDHARVDEVLCRDEELGSDAEAAVEELGSGQMKGSGEAGDDCVSAGTRKTIGSLDMPGTESIASVVVVAITVLIIAIVPIFPIALVI